MLPPDFRWMKAAVTAYNEEVVALGDVWVVRMYQEGWGSPYVAALDRHLPPDQQTRRRCTTYQQGRIGVERWVQRHQDRLRAEIDRLEAQGAADKR